MATNPFSTAASHGAQPVTMPIPLRDILPWAFFGLLLSLIFLYFVSTEQGAFALFAGTTVHEFVHDGRHLLGFPCH